MITGIATCRGRITATLILALLMSGAAFAEEEADPPDLAARLSLLQGDVSMVDGESGDLIEATLNRPLTGGDEIIVGRGSRAELQLGLATLHLDEGARLSLLELDEEVVALRLSGGAMVAHIRELPDDGELSIDTSNARVSLLQPGEYTITAQDSRDITYVAVREGESEIRQGSQVFSLRSSEEGRYSGASSLVEDIRTPESRDDFERWAYERDSRAERSTSARYVSSSVVGYEDLDDHGYWERDSLYGSVWYPRHMSYGWAPYRFGHWSYVGPWGWTWIDQSPWGFAPFHYGRWAFHRSRWCWVPGPRHLRAVYAPALVGWRGSGSNVAWFPLAPHERYVPRHRASDRYLRNVNDSNTLITRENPRSDVRVREPQRRYANEHVGNAVTAVSQTAFTSGKPVARNLVRIDSRDAQRIRTMLPPPTVIPGRNFAPPASTLRDRPPREITPQPRVQNPARDVRIPRGEIPAPGRNVLIPSRPNVVPNQNARAPEARVPSREVRIPQPQRNNQIPQRDVRTRPPEMPQREARPARPPFNSMESSPQLRHVERNDRRR